MVHVRISRNCIRKDTPSLDVKRMATSWFNMFIYLFIRLSFYLTPQSARVRRLTIRQVITSQFLWHFFCHIIWTLVGSAYTGVLQLESEMATPSEGNQGCLLTDASSSEALSGATAGMAMISTKYISLSLLIACGRKQRLVMSLPVAPCIS